MIKAGPERDKVIAEIRGDDPNEKGKLGFKVGYKPYSTSIVHAMELWDEMKGERARLDLMFTPTWDSEKGMNVAPWRISVRFGYYGHHIADTEADAISGAYLKWRSDD